MRNQEENTDKEILRINKMKSEEARILAKQEALTKAYQAKEQEAEKAQKLKDEQRAAERAKEEIIELAKEKARKQAYMEREQKIAEDQEARKLKNS